MNLSLNLEEDHVEHHSVINVVYCDIKPVLRHSFIKNKQNSGEDSYKVHTSDESHKNVKHRHTVECVVNNERHTHERHKGQHLYSNTYSDCSSNENRRSVRYSLYFRDSYHVVHYRYFRIRVVNYDDSVHSSHLSTEPDCSYLLSLNLVYAYEDDYDSSEHSNHVFHSQKRHDSCTRSSDCLNVVSLSTKQVYVISLLFVENSSKKV